METIVEYARGLVYSLISLMPSTYQKASLKVMLGIFLEAQGHPLPQHTELKSASALSRFLNHYEWSTRGVIRATRQAILLIEGLRGTIATLGKPIFKERFI